MSLTLLVSWAHNLYKRLIDKGEWYTDCRRRQWMICDNVDSMQKLSSKLLWDPGSTTGIPNKDRRFASNKEALRLYQISNM